MVIAIIVELGLSAHYVGPLVLRCFTCPLFTNKHFLSGQFYSVNRRHLSQYREIQEGQRKDQMHYMLIA